MRYYTVHSVPGANPPAVICAYRGDDTNHTLGVEIPTSKPDFTGKEGIGTDVAQAQAALQQAFLEDALSRPGKMILVAMQDSGDFQAWIMDPDF